MTFGISVLAASFQFKLEFQVNDQITPLLDIPVEVTVDYKNIGGTEKRPIVNNVKGIRTATPLIDFYMSEPNTTATSKIKPGQKMEFVIDILMVKMRSPLHVEVRKFEGSSIESIWRGNYNTPFSKLICAIDWLRHF